MQRVAHNNQAKRQTGGTRLDRAAFLPVTAEDMHKRGWDAVDFVYVVGDAYVDHPSFGSAIISRVLESRGYRVGMICQPDFRDPKSVTVFGEPRLAFLVSSGNMDSMVNHYTVAKKRRHTDAYTPGGEIGKRPDRAVIVYGNLIRQTYKKTPLIIGGIEASLRRFGHYDYWSDSVRRSILLEAGADLISYGMGEKSIVEIAEALESGLDVRDITFIDGTVYKTRDEASIYDAIRLPDYEEISIRKTPSGNDGSPSTQSRPGSPAESAGKTSSLTGSPSDLIAASKRACAKSVRIQYENTDPYQAKRIYEPYGGKLFVVQNPPAKPLSMQEMDDIYALPYTRSFHPMYKEAGGIPALAEIKFSLTSNRGCYGGCHFCALTYHEGRIVQVRSHESIIAEAEEMIKDPEFKGYIHDVGGPTAEFRAPACRKQLTKGACSHRQCLFPEPCPNLEVDHSDYLSLLRKLRALPGVKKVFVRSGVRFDYLMADKDRTFLKELCKYHVSGQLRVAPEHISDAVLSRMGKPPVSVYNSFVREFDRTQKAINQAAAREAARGGDHRRSGEAARGGEAPRATKLIEQYLVPYLMSSHPGSTLKEAVELAEYLHAHHLDPDQVQDFYPTPGTISTCMYDTGLDPLTMKPVYVSRDPHEKAMQRALIQYRRPENHALVLEALRKAGREDLIGFGQECLIPPRLVKEKDRRSAKKGQRPKTQPKNSRKRGQGR